MDRKYELVKDDTIVVNNIILHRIKALKNFNDIEKGDLGGYIEKEENLSQEGNCWVYGDSEIYGDTRIIDDAYVFGKIRMSGDICVAGKAYIELKTWKYDGV